MKGGPKREIKRAAKRNQQRAADEAVAKATWRCEFGGLWWQHHSGTFKLFVPDLLLTL